jgi:PAS domain S-box-containing protein
MLMVVHLSTSMIRFLLWIFVIVTLPILTVAFIRFIPKLPNELDFEQYLIAWTAFMVFTVLLIASKKIQPTTSALLHIRELVASQKKFSFLYEGSPIPYITLNRKGVITLTNLASLRFFNTTAEDLMGKNFKQLLVVPDEQVGSIIFGRLETGQVINDVEVELLRLDGTRRWVRLSIFVYKEDSERLVSLVDITEQKRIDSAKSEFVSLASHQLRTPISAARWNLELLSSYQPVLYDEKQLNYIDKIERSVLKMNALIDDFLSVSKLETGTFATEIKQVNLTLFFNSIIDEFEQEVSKKKLQVIKNYEPIDLTLEIDERLLHISVSNLFSNAVKYCRNNGVVEISYKFNDGHLQIIVSDSGIGIPINDIEELFKKFYRASNARLHKTEGTGLGLYIVKQAIEKMGGTISVVSEENVGTRFTIDL